MQYHIPMPPTRHTCNVVVQTVQIRIHKGGIRDQKSQAGENHKHNPAGSFAFDKVLKELCHEDFLAHLDIR